MFRIFVFISFLASVLSAQDLTGRWLAVTGYTSGYYAELYLIKNYNNVYSGHAYDTEEGGYCRHWLNAEFNEETQFFNGIDVELINKSPEHEATDYQLRYVKDEDGKEYLVGTSTIKPLSERVNTEGLTPLQKLQYQMFMTVQPPKYVKYVKVSDNYKVYNEEMPHAMSPEEMMLEKAAFEDVFIDEDEYTVHDEISESVDLTHVPESETEEVPEITEPEENVAEQETEITQTEKPAKEKEEPTISEKKASRNNQLLSHLQLKTGKVTLLIRDYGTVDNDTVTIFFNDRLLAENIRITSEAREFEIEIEPGKRNELVFVANNLGDVAPNTARITLIADDRRYNYKLFTDEKNNALILLENVGKLPD